MKNKIKSVAKLAAKGAIVVPLWGLVYCALYYKMLRYAASIKRSGRDAK